MVRKRFSEALLDDAQLVFERRMARPVSRAEAARMLEELTDFFHLLHQADQRQGGDLLAPLNKGEGRPRLQ